jgi:hypothetical protein
MAKVYISGIVDAEALGGVATHPIAPGGQPGVPTQPIYYPPYPSQGPGFPSNPIAPGGLPPYATTGPGFPTAPIYIPIDPPTEVPGLTPGHPIYIPVYPSTGPGFPTNPIAPGGSQPGIWPNPEAIRAAIKRFLTGNPPPSAQPV